MLLFHYLKNLYVEILRNPNTFVKCCMIIEENQKKKKKDKGNKEREKKQLRKK